MQWAAVRTCLELMIVPPQKGASGSWGLTSATCHGKWLAGAVSPFTMRFSRGRPGFPASSAPSSLARPQEQSPVQVNVA